MKNIYYFYILLIITLNINTDIDMHINGRKQDTGLYIFVSDHCEILARSIF